MSEAYVYLLASRKDGAIYLGVTDNLHQRIEQHKTGRGSHHASKYQIQKLVWFETFPDKIQARAQEYRMKKWPRQWKINLIEELNPEWEDLALKFNL